MFYEVLKLCRRTVYFASTYTIWIYTMEVYASVCTIAVYFFLHLQRTLLKVELATVSTRKLRDSLPPSISRVLRKLVQPSSTTTSTRSTDSDRKKRHEHEKKMSGKGRKNDDGWLRSWMLIPRWLVYRSRRGKTFTGYFWLLYFLEILPAKGK